MKRLKYYGVGFGFGIIFVVFFFQNRGCSWLPSNRVKNTILDRVLVIDESTEKQMLKMNLSTDDVVQVLNDGDILFNESDKNREHKCYIIEKEGVTYAFTLPAESFISQVFVDVKNEVKSTSTKGEGRLIHFPMDDNLVYVDTSHVLACQEEQLGVEKPQEIYKSLIENGKIDFEKSNLLIRPKAEHFLLFEFEGQEIGANFIWYKDKLNLIAFKFEGSDKCLSIGEVE